MSKKEVRRLAEEYVEKQFAAMPKLGGQKAAKVPAHRRKKIVASLVRVAKSYRD